MNIVVYLDAIVLIASLVGCTLLLIRSQKFKQQLGSRISLFFLLFMTALYGTALFIEWEGITNAFDEYEDLIGALIPMLWAFVFYSIIQQQSNHDLLESEERMQLAIKGTQAGLWDWNITEGTLVINERWAEIIGKKVSDLQPISIETWKNLAHPHDLEQSNTLIKKHFNRELDFYECEIRMLHQEGHWVWVHDRGMVVERDVNGNPLRMTGTHIDINTKKQAQLALKVQMDENIALNEEYLAQNEELSKTLIRIQEINTELTIAKQKAEQSDQLKSAFLANISHEIRTPMNGIIGFTEMLSVPNLTIEKRNYYSKVVVDSSNKLLSIVTDIIDISRIQTGNIILNKKQFDINQLIDELAEEWRPQLKDKNIPLVTHKGLDIEHSWMIGDKIRLRQIINNLMSNAVKFTEKGYICLAYNKKDNFLEFIVEDTGIGIEPDALNDIFEPFRQVEIGSTRNYGGTGLGLSISKKLTEILGGRIWVESTPNKGSSFYFSIPFQQN